MTTGNGEWAAGRVSVGGKVLVLGVFLKGGGQDCGVHDAQLCRVKKGVMDAHALPLTQFNTHCTHLSSTSRTDSIHLPLSLSTVLAPNGPACALPHW